MKDFGFAFACLDRVHIDGDGGIAGVVTAICFEVDRVTYRVEWIANGAAHSAYFDAARLSHALLGREP